MEKEDVKEEIPVNQIEEATKIYTEQRDIVQEALCTYEQLVVADVTMTNIVSELEKTIDNINANIGLDKSLADAPESKIQRAIKDRTIDERHLWRICKGLLRIIKSKMYREAK